MDAIRAAEEKVDRLRRLLSIAECESAKALKLYMEANQCRLETIRQNTELERQNAELQAKLDRKKQDMDRFLCSICYKHLVDTTTSCQHVFCRKCVDEWMRVQALEDRNHQFEFVDDTHAEEVLTFLCPICAEKVKDNEVYTLYFSG
jgi:hypothetical protein